MDLQLPVAAHRAKCSYEVRRTSSLDHADAHTAPHLMALPARPLSKTKVPLRAASGNSPRLNSPAKKRLGHALAYGGANKNAQVTVAQAMASRPSDLDKPAATMTPEEAVSATKKLAATIMSRTKIPTGAGERLELAKGTMVELCAGLMARGAIAVEVATAGCCIDAALLPHIEAFMGWVQSGFLDSITMADHGALLRAQCGEINREIDLLLKGGEVRKFVAGLRANDAKELEDAVSAAKDRVKARQKNNSPAKSIQRSASRPRAKASARGASPARANSAPPGADAGAPRTTSNGSEAASQPRVATTRRKVWAPAIIPAAPKAVMPVPSSRGGSRANSVRTGRRPITAGTASSEAKGKTEAAVETKGNMGQAVENALKMAERGEKRRRAAVQSEKSAEEAAASRKKGAGNQAEPLFESWKEKGKILAAASESFRKNTASSIKKTKNNNEGVDDLKAELARLKGPAGTRPATSRAKGRKATEVPAGMAEGVGVPARGAYDDFVAAFAEDKMKKQACEKKAAEAQPTLGGTIGSGLDQEEEGAGAVAAYTPREEGADAGGATPRHQLAHLAVDAKKTAAAAAVVAPQETVAPEAGDNDDDDEPMLTRQQMKAASIQLSNSGEESAPPAEQPAEAAE